MKMNVTFRVGETFNGWKIIARNGLTEFVAKKGDISVGFRSDTGAGRNYFTVQWARDDATQRTYQAQRYLYKYIPIVRELSYELLKKYRNQ